MRRSRRRRDKTRAVTVAVDMPLDVDISSVRAVEPQAFPDKFKRVVATRKPRGPMVRRTVRVILPRKFAKARKGYAMIRAGKVSIYGQKSTDRLLEREQNRRRYQERKRRHRRYSDGQVHSLRGDRFGIVGHALSKGVSGSRLDDVAMVARAIERGWKR